MPRVISLEEKRIEKSPHMEGEAKCMACGHRWAVVVPVTGEVVGLECPKCGLMRGYFAYPVWPGNENEEIFTCNCGGEIFCLRRKGALCVRCGMTHSWTALGF